MQCGAEAGVAEDFAGMALQAVAWKSYLYAMVDILVFTERIKNEIAIGESDFREFKSAWEGKPGQKKPRLVKKICEDIAEALVAFANSDGGAILIGVEDDGALTGVPHAEEDQQQMLAAPRSHVLNGSHLPMVYASRVQLEGKVVLFFQVRKGTEAIFQLQDGRVLVRKGSETMPVAIKALQFTQQEVRSREYDLQFVDGATVADLDLDLVQSLAHDYLPGLSAERYLQQMDLAHYFDHGLRLRRAALLLFAKDILRWQPHSMVRFVRIDGTEIGAGPQYNVVSDEMVRGNIYLLAFRAWEELRPYIAVGTAFTTQGTFEQQFAYPPNACQEAILNAIAHRDYSSHNGVEVHIFHDRLEIKSPGPLLSTLKIEDLLALDGRHESRNAKIAFVLKTNKIMREMGEGMKRIFQAMEGSGLPRPRLYSNTTWFSVTLYKTPTVPK